MKEFGGMLTERVVIESTPARKSSQAPACGTRAFIASHFARAALIDALSRKTALTTPPCERVSPARRIGALSALMSTRMRIRFMGRKEKKIPADVCLRRFSPQRGDAGTWLGLSRMFRNRADNRARSFGFGC